MSYTNFKRGSEWRRWDLHIHTPETKKNDQFAGSTPEEKWTNYIDAINASLDDVAVIGITDYFCIDNYFKFKTFQEAGRITKKFELVVPNIELRITPVSGSSTPINIHCIFNPKIDTEIETRFLSKLRFKYADSEFSAVRSELIRLGKALPGNSNIDDKGAYNAGLGQYVISVTDLRALFEKDEELRNNTIIVVSNKSSDGASGLRHEEYFIAGKSQLDATRWSIYQFSDAIFSASPGDILYFLGQGADKKNVVIEKCLSLMPCFHGCDAHSLDEIFKPNENRFCWIKADPTFEGLKQTLYEPEDRVKIQALKPDLKNDRYLISELRFIDAGTLFGNQSIMLNENLNAIIGGKSSGKSLLLYATAKSIDSEQVKNASTRLGFDGYTFDSDFDFEVLWKNGDSNRYKDVTGQNSTHKITYIPQLYINYLVEKNNKEELNALINNILLQDNAFRNFYDNSIERKNAINNDAEVLLSNYLQIRLKINELLKQSSEIGKSETIQQSIQTIEAKILEGQRLSNLTRLEVEEYNGLVLEQSRLEKVIQDLTNKETALNKIIAEVEAAKTNLLGGQSSEMAFPIKGQVDRIIDDYTVLDNDLEQIKSSLKIDFDVVIANLRNRMDGLNLALQKQQNNEQLTTVNNRLIPFAVKLSEQKELQTLGEHLQRERQRLTQAQNLERQKQLLTADYTNTREQIANLLRNRIDRYTEIVNLVNSTKDEIGSGIHLKAELIYKLENFQLYHQCNKAALSGDHFFNSLFSGGFVQYHQLPEIFSQFLRIHEEKLLIDQQRSIPLKQGISLEDLLRGMLKDCLEIDYSVTYKGDDLLKMSPGKKGTVLLILFLQISSAEHPILIDQPEDNLDNRTIYDLLCDMIKRKKKERQIIIVSHNANLVVATDTENVIVANQEGQDAPIAALQTRFQYVNGAIEHSFKDDSKTILLYKQGIKEHVTDILEGGDEAFKQREKKYNIK